MNEMIATIQFVGLCLFTTAVPPHDRMNVLLPRSEASQPSRQSWLPWRRKAAPAIEEHSAVIVFRDEDAQAEIGWTSQDFTPDAAFQYVRLSGETVTFHTTGPNVAIPQERLKLPEMKACCNMMAKQRIPETRRAAAIVKIDRGSLSTCTVEPTAEDPISERADTRLAIRNSGSLVIWATARGQTKALVLKGDAKVFISNLPTRMMTDGIVVAAHHHGLPHYEAYYSLLKHDRNCSLKRGLIYPEVLAACATKTLRFHYDSKEVVSSECSNSQWP